MSRDIHFETKYGLLSCGIANGNTVITSCDWDEVNCPACHEMRTNLLTLQDEKERQKTRPLSIPDQVAIISQDHEDELEMCQAIAAKLKKLSNWSLRGSVREFCTEAPLAATIRHMHDKEYLLAAWHLLDIINEAEKIRKAIDA